MAIVETSFEIVKKNNNQTNKNNLVQYVMAMSKRNTNELINEPLLSGGPTDKEDSAFGDFSRATHSLLGLGRRYHDSFLGFVQSLHHRLHFSLLGAAFASLQRKRTQQAEALLPRCHLHKTHAQRRHSNATATPYFLPRMLILTTCRSVEWESVGGWVGCLATPVYFYSSYS